VAAHADHHAPEPSAGAALLPLFAIGVVLATIAIGVVVAAPSVVAVIVTLSAVIGFAAALVVVLSRLIGPGGH
jgi:hypothetical protein